MYWFVNITTTGVLRPKTPIWSQRQMNNKNMEGSRVSHGMNYQVIHQVIVPSSEVLNQFFFFFPLVFISSILIILLSYYYHVYYMAREAARHDKPEPKQTRPRPVNTINSAKEVKSVIELSRYSTSGR